MKRRPVWTQAQLDDLQRIRDEQHNLEALLWGCIVLMREAGLVEHVDQLNAAKAPPLMQRVKSSPTRAAAMDVTE